MTETALPGTARAIGYAFLFWLAFLLALEPGNVLHARSLGHTLALDREALRIGIAALLGSSVTPLLILLSRRFPVASARRSRHLAVHVVGAAALSFALILVSCFLAAWALQGKLLPSLVDIRSQLAANWLLLVCVLGVLTAIIPAMKLSPPAARPGRVAIRTRGGESWLDIASIEWIESQGNYLALHAAGRSHLIRETLASFSSQLDPQRFVRIHRRVIVAIDRVREIQTLPNGDSTLILEGGHALRASRSYRASIRTHLPKGLPRTAS
jgi:two-component system LytT family response regulator